MRSVGILLVFAAFLVGPTVAQANTAWEDPSIKMIAGVYDAMDAGLYSDSGQESLSDMSPAGAGGPTGDLVTQDVLSAANKALAGKDPGYNVQVVPTVPIPGAVWLFGAGLVGLLGLRKKLHKQ